MSKFLILICGERSKKVPVNGSISISYIKECVRTKFEVENFLLKYFDSDVLEYIDLDNDDDLSSEDRVTKIKVIKRDSIPEDNLKDIAEKVSEPESPYPSSPPVTPIPSSPATPGPSSRPATPGPSSRPATPGPSPRPATPGPSSRPDTPSPSSHDKTQRKPWPRLYQFPITTAPRSLMMKLEGKNALEKGDVFRLLDTVYNDVNQYEGGLYPTSDKYDQIVDGILKMLPQLVAESGMPLQSVRMYWREKLKYKWQNERKFKDKNLPEVVARKRKQEQRLPPNVPKDQAQLTWGMANFLPPTLDSEDETSILLHKQWLKDEHKKTSQNITVVDMKMDLTFPSRRKGIITENMETTAVIQEYPFLNDRRQLLLEFKRLGPNSINKLLDEQFYDGLDNYFEAINSLTKGKKVPDFQKLIIEQIATQHCSSQRKYTSQCAAILGISTLLKEKMEKVLCFGYDTREGEESVVLIVNDNILATNDDAFQLKIDGNVIFSCDTFMELFTGFIAAIYCFNLVYPKQIEKTLLFVQNALLGLNDGGKVDKKIVSVITELNRERMKNK